MGPYVRARLRFPRLGVQDWVEFLVDSGADRTILHPGVNLAIRIPYHRLRSGSKGIATGIGGSRNYYLEPCVLVFEDDQSDLLQCRLTIFIADSTESELVPSLLGRDFLNLCDVRLNHARNLVALEPLNVDSSFIRPPLLTA